MHKTGIILFATAAFMAAVVIYHHPPGNNAWYPPCMFKKITGLDCPGCGSTRACYHLLHGHVTRAADHNILLLIFLPIMMIGLTAPFVSRLQTLWQALNRPFIILCIVLVFWLLRNIPCFPFTLLHSDK